MTHDGDAPLVLSTGNLLLLSIAATDAAAAVAQQDDEINRLGKLLFVGE